MLSHNARIVVVKVFSLQEPAAGLGERNVDQASEDINALFTRTCHPSEFNIIINYHCIPSETRAYRMLGWISTSKIYVVHTYCG
jgi:hypothetical protein